VENLLMKWVAFSLSVFIVAKLMPGVHVRSLLTAAGVALVYGVLKTLLYWVLVILSLPFIIVTLGLFLVVINAFLLWITDKLIAGFKIDGCLTTIIASVLISLFDLLLRWVLPGT
jgi:putative membrane protein